LPGESTAVAAGADNVRLIHAAKFGEAVIGGFTVVEFEAVLREGVADAQKIGSGKTVLRKSARRSAKNLREIDDGVASDRKGEFGLAFAGAFDADEDEGAGIENCSERGDPGLIVVLRTEVREHRIREMAFHQLGGPAFPVLQ